MKDKKLKFGLALLAALAAVFAAGCSDGSDTPTVNYTYDSASNTYTVYTAEGLLAWNEAAQSDLSTNCTLGANITLTSEWTPVGTNDSRYTGTFEGNGHAITGLTVSQDSTNYAGLIGYLGSEGKVQNLTLENVSITGNNYVGGVAGTNRGAVTNCNVSGSRYVGGVAGYNRGAVTACYSTASVSGNNMVGGVVGRNSDTVTACYSTGSVSGSSNVGGVVGQNDSSGTVTACYWSGYDGDGIGTDNANGEATQVDGTNAYYWAEGTSTANAMVTMNNAIYTWNNTSGNENCDWQYTTTGATDDEPLKLEAGAPTELTT